MIKQHGERQTERADMNVFLCWSGDRSKAVSDAFYRFFEDLFRKFDHFHMYYSLNTEKGADWDRELEKELDNANLGILFLTEENCRNPSPWMMYEAGVLSKTAECVLTFRLNISAGDVPGAVRRPQSTYFMAGEVQGNGLEDKENKRELLALSKRVYDLYIQIHPTDEEKVVRWENGIQGLADYLCNDLMDELKTASKMEESQGKPSGAEKMLEKTNRILKFSKENRVLLRRILSGWPYRTGIPQLNGGGKQPESSHFS